MDKNVLDIINRYGGPRKRINGPSGLFYPWFPRHHVKRGKPKNTVRQMIVDAMKRRPKMSWKQKAYKKAKKYRHFNPGERTRQLKNVPAYRRMMAKGYLRHALRKKVRRMRIGKSKPLLPKYFGKWRNSFRKSGAVWYGN